MCDVPAAFIHVKRARKSHSVAVVVYSIHEPLTLHPPRCHPIAGANGDGSTEEVAVDVEAEPPEPGDSATLLRPLLAKRRVDVAGCGWLYNEWRSPRTENACLNSRRRLKSLEFTTY